MSTDMDETIRETLRELADEARLTNLATPALRQAGRMRTRRTVLTVAAGLVAVAATATPYLVTRPADRGTAPPPAAAITTRATRTAAPPAAPSIGNGPVVLPGGWILASGPVGATYVIWDRVQGRYRPLPYSQVSPAPTGNHVAVEKTEENRVGVLDLNSGEVRWMNRRTGNEGVDWSSDGRYFLYPGAPSRPGDNSVMSAVVVEAATGRERVVKDNLCATCRYTWLASDTEVAIDTGGATMQAYAVASGEPTRTVPSSLVVTYRHTISPDGRYAVQPTGGSVRDARVVELATGRIVSRLTVDDARAVYWAGDDQLLVVEPGAVTAQSLTGQDRRRYPFPREFGDDELHNFVLVRQ